MKLGALNGDDFGHALVIYQQWGFYDCPRWKSCHIDKEKMMEMEL